MPSVLITAFEPYDRWSENSSWLALVALTQSLPAEPTVVTRRYPVDFDKAKARLAEDLAADYDFALHLGQSPYIGRIHLEAIGINVRGEPGMLPDQFGLLAEEGPAAYRSPLPLARWAGLLREAGIPAQVSYDAGTYLCNGVLYLSQHIAARQKLKTRSTFLHLPMAPSQVLSERQSFPTLPSETCAAGIRIILEELET